MQIWSTALLVAQAGAEELPAGSILPLDQSLLVQIAIEAFNILILTVILVFILYKPVKKFMKNRSERIQNEIETARLEREEAQELKESYEKLIQDIELEREEILKQAHKNAMERSDQIILEARQEAEAIYARSLAELEVERNNIQDEMKQQMVEVSMAVAKRFVEVSLDRDSQDQLIEQALDDWEEGLYG